MLKPIVDKVLKSPVLHFVVLGTAVFWAYTEFRPTDRETIVVTTQTIDALIQQRESITQDPITAEEKQNLIAGHIEEEILLREAYKRGFDKNDYRVRKRILNLMRSYMSEVIPEPSLAQLRAYYQQNKERFLTSSSRSFEQIYFSFAGANQPQDPAQFLQQLKGASDTSDLGDFSTSLSNRFTRTSFQTTAITFGKPFARIVFDLPLNRWHGPVESFQGIHYVRVTSEHQPELPPFEQMESYLRTDYFLRKARQSQQDKIAELKKSYDVVVEGVENP